MGISLNVKDLILPDGSREALPADGITVIVGPNNIGKSAVLKDVINLLRYIPHSPPAGRQRNTIILDGITIESSGSAEDLLGFFREYGPAPVERDGVLVMGNPHRSPNLQFGQIVQGFMNPLGGLGEGAELLTSCHLTDNRLQMLGGAPVHNVLTDSALHPLQRMYADPALWAKYKELVRGAFGIELTFNPYHAQIDLRVGTTSIEPTPPPAPVELLREFEALPPAANQGDGVRSFLGLLLHVIIPGSPVVIVDEPEAFLHPSQARLMGRVLVDETPVHTQIILATHSLQLLQGILESASRDIKIIKLTRDHASNVQMRSLDPDEIRSTWSDSLLRYSNLLDGLFHSGVILGESDADSRFYSATLDVACDRAAELDLLFTHVGGKARIGKAIEQLRRFAIPVAAIVDLDLLNDAGLFRRTIEQAGGDWSEFEADFRTVTAGVSTLGVRPPNVGAVKAAVGEALSGAADRELLTKPQRSAVERAVAFTSAWEQIKRSGLAGLPQGGSAGAAARLLDRLKALGIFLVPVGELERWLPEVPGKSGEWVAHVLDGGLHLKPSADLSRFVLEVASFLRPDIVQSR